MYLDFYLLKKEPFHVTPDPEFLFLSPSHKAALRTLVYGVEERQGFVALLGEVGLGKTTILRSYLERVDQSQLKPIHLIHPKLSFLELLHTLCQECGLEGTTENIAETITGLHHVLTGEYQQGRNVALLVDEAQHMPLERSSSCCCSRIWKPQRRSFSRLSWWASPNLKPSSMPRPCGSSNSAW